MKKTLSLLFTLGIGAGILHAQDQPVAKPPSTILTMPNLSTKIWDDFSLHNVSTKAHKALGYATVTLGATAFVLGHLDGHSTAHQVVGETAAIGAGATVVTGFVAHFDELKFSGDLLTWNNLHALLGGAGATMMAGSGLIGGQSGHSALGDLGTFLMALAIVLEG